MIVSSDHPLLLASEGKSYSEMSHAELTVWKAYYSGRIDLAVPYTQANLRLCSELEAVLSAKCLPDIGKEHVNVCMRSDWQGQQAG